MSWGTNKAGGGAPLASATPAAIGTAAVGVSTSAARADHVHALAAKVVVVEAAVDLANEVNLGALSPGILKHAVAAGVSAPATASAGVDYAKGPWKLFSTVRNVAAAQTLSIPVVDGENNGIIRAVGRLLSDGTDRNVTVKINGSATNVVMECVGTSTGASAVAFSTIVGDTGTGHMFFELVMVTCKKTGLFRTGFIKTATVTSAGAIFGVYVGTVTFKDKTTAITTIDLDCANATGLALDTEGQVEEGIYG